MKTEFVLPGEIEKRSFESSDCDRYKYGVVWNQ